MLHLVHQSTKAKSISCVEMLLSPGYFLRMYCTYSIFNVIRYGVIRDNVIRYGVKRAAISLWRLTELEVDQYYNLLGFDS